MVKLYIPYGIKIEKEIILGFGKREMKHFCIGMVFSAVVGAAWTLLSGEMAGLIISLVVGAVGSYWASRREAYSQSIVGIIKNTIAYHREQQRFKYVYKKW